MSTTEQSKVEVLINGVQASTTIKEMEANVRKLRAEWRGLNKDSDDFKKVSKSLDEANRKLKEQRSEISGTSKAFSLFKNEFLNLTTSMAAGNIIAMGIQGALAGVVGFFSSAVKGAADLSDQFADVRKTTGMTAEEVKHLNSQLSKIDTRTSTKELRSIAIVAGQLGIAKKDIASFTEATDKLNVALGDEFGGGVEEITKTLGGLRRVLTDSNTGDISTDMLRIGNALNVLGAEGAATSPVVADFANRIGSVGGTLGLTSGQILGLSAALQEMNVSTERGGTAVTKILLKMTKNYESFANIAGVKTSEFKNMVNNDLFGALLKVAEGSQKSSKQATEFSAMLDQLGVDGSGASEVFSKLGKNIEFVKDKVGTASNALKDSSSILEEFNLKNNTLAAKLEKLSKKFMGLFRMPGLGDSLSGIVEFLSQMLDHAKPVVKIFGDFFSALGEIGSAIMDMLKSLGVVSGTMTTAELVMKILITSLRAASIPIKVLANSFTIAADALGYLTNEGKKLLNTFGGNFKVDPNLDLSKIKADIKKMGTILTEPFAKIGDNTDEAKEHVSDFTKFSKSELKVMALGGIQGAEDELKAREELTKKQIEEQKRFNQNTMKLREQLEQMKASAIENEENRDEALLKAKYAKQIEEVKNTKANATVKAELIKQMEITMQRELDDIHKKHFEKRKEDEFKETEESLKANSNAAREGLAKQFEEGLINRHQYNADLKKLELDQLVEKRQMYLDYGKDVNDIDKAIVDKKTEIEKISQDEMQAAYQQHLKEMQRAAEMSVRGSQENINIRKQLLLEQLNQELSNTELTEEQKYNIVKYYQSLIDKLSEEKFAKAAENIQRFGQMAGEALGSVHAIMDNNDQKELSKEKKQNDAKKRMLQDQLDRKIISQAKFQKESEKLQADLDAKTAEVNRKQAKRQKEEAIFSAVIQNSVNVIKALGSGLIVPNFVMGGIAAGLGALQIAAIASKPLPEYASGGVTGMSGRHYPNAKYVSSFAKGGKYSSASYGIIGEAGPELVVPNWLYEHPKMINTWRAVEGMIAGKEFAAGGSTASNTSTSNFIPPAVGDSVEMLKAAAMIQDAAMRIIQRMDMPLNAEIKYGQIEKASSDVNTARRQASL